MTKVKKKAVKKTVKKKVRKSVGQSAGALAPVVRQRSRRGRMSAYVRTDKRGVLSEVINQGVWRSVLTGQMNQGAVLGNHYHKWTEVYFHLLTGQAIVRTADVKNGRRDELVLSPNMGVFLPAMESHAIRFTRKSNFIMLKSEPYDDKQPDTYPFPVT